MSDEKGVGGSGGVYGGVTLFRNGRVLREIQIYRPGGCQRRIDQRSGAIYRTAEGYQHPPDERKNGEFCSRHPDAKDGVRIDHKITSTQGLLQNAVVFIEDIESGKEWGTGSAEAGGGPAGFTYFQFRNCEIVPKVTVVRKSKREEKTGNLTVATRTRGFCIILSGIW